MNFSKKLVPALLGLVLTVGASASWAAAPGALVTGTSPAMFSDASGMALNSFQASGAYGLGSTASISSLAGLGATPVTFQQVEGSAPLATGDSEFTSLASSANPQGNWRVLIAGLSLIGFLMVRRSAQL